MSATFYVEQNQVTEIRTIVVHTFTVGDVEDPDIYAGMGLGNWENSEAGQWVMENAVEVPTWHREVDQYHWGHRYAITAKLKDSDISYYILKWGSK